MLRTQRRFIPSRGPAHFFPTAGSPPPSLRRWGRRSHRRSGTGPSGSRPLGDRQDHRYRHARHARRHARYARDRGRKLLPAMNAQKQAGVIEAGQTEHRSRRKPPAHRRDHIAVVQTGQRWIQSLSARHGHHRQTARYHTGSAMPTSPPYFTSVSLRLFIPKSTPAAPAVAKNPITLAMMVVKARSTAGRSPGTSRCRLRSGRTPS